MPVPRMALPVSDSEARGPGPARGVTVPLDSEVRVTRAAGVIFEPSPSQSLPVFRFGIDFVEPESCFPFMSDSEMIAKKNVKLDFTGIMIPSPRSSSSL